MHMFVKAAETITKLKLHASTTVDSPLWPADHKNLSTESMHLTWVGCCSAVERNTHTHTPRLISPSQTDFPQSKRHPQPFLQKTPLLLYPQGFSFLLPSPLFPVFFQQQPLFHSWELWPFKEKGSVSCCAVCVSLCVFVCVSDRCSPDHPST